MSDINCKKPKPCPPDVDNEVELPRVEPFEFCAGNKIIKYDGLHLTFEDGPTIPDGEYDKVVVKDGCIVSYSEGDVPSYTPPYCNNNPAPCSDNGDSSRVSPQAGNTLKDTSLGRYARTYINSGNGVTLSGVGTQTNPYLISADLGGVSNVSFTEDNPHIKITELSDGVYGIGLVKNTNLEAGEYAGFAVDDYGFIVGYSAPENSEIKGLVEGIDLIITNANGVYTIGHENQDTGNQTYSFGAYDVDLNSSGHITSAERMITVEEGVYQLGDYKVSVTEDGMINDIELSPVPPAEDQA